MTTTNLTQTAAIPTTLRLGLILALVVALLAAGQLDTLAHGYQGPPTDPPGKPGSGDNKMEDKPDDSGNKLEEVPDNSGNKLEDDPADNGNSMNEDPADNGNSLNEVDLPPIYVGPRDGMELVLTRTSSGRVQATIYTQAETLTSSIDKKN